MIEIHGHVITTLSVCLYNFSRLLKKINVKEPKMINILIYNWLWMLIILGCFTLIFLLSFLQNCLIIPCGSFPAKVEITLPVLLSSHLTVAILEVVSKFQLQLNNTKKMHSTFMYIYYRLKSTLEKFGIL